MYFSVTHVRLTEIVRLYAFLCNTCKIVRLYVFLCNTCKIVRLYVFLCNTCKIDRDCEKGCMYFSVTHVRLTEIVRLYVF